MNKKIVIASDSTSDLNPELIERYDIKRVPLAVNLSGKIYSDGIDVDPEMIYAHYEKTGELPKTAAPNIADFEDFFAKYTADGSEIVFFTISSEMSSTYSNARLAASEFEGVYVVDTRNLSTGGGLLVVSAAEMAKEGLSASEIAEKCEELKSRVDASFVIDNLEFLHKGGRCSAVAAFGANVLQLKPCITVSNGKMGVDKKYRGKFSKVLETYVADRIGDASDIDLSHVFVTHAGCAPEVYEAAELLIDAGDWINLMLTGEDHRSACAAGYKGLWHYRDGYPADFIRALDPRMADLIGKKIPADVVPVGAKVGEITAEGAKRCSLAVGTAVGASIIDAHAALPAAGITDPGRLLLIVGTSGVQIVLGEEDRDVPGMCGVVRDGVIPGYLAYESAQAALGDQFDWFVKNCVPAAYTAEAEAAGMNIHKFLREKAKKLAVGESGLVALDSA